MKENQFNYSVEFAKANLVLFDLRLKALNIKNGYQVRNSINSLMDFVGISNFRTANT